MSEKGLIIGTRGSALAMEQARRVQAGILGVSEIRIVHTSGDRLKEQPLGEKNPVGFFTKEIEDELLAGHIDLAVHSLKDLPIEITPNLLLGAVLARDFPSDVLLIRPESFDPASEIPLKREATVGASSRRRQALLQHYRPDLGIKPIRGNVTTRIDKVRNGDYDATLLSQAGLERLHLDTSPLAVYELNPQAWPTAPGQAVIAVEIRSEDDNARAHLSSLEDISTRERIQVERSLLAAFGGGCHAPFGAFCTTGETVTLAVCAPGSKGGFHIERFTASRLEDVREAAAEWIRAGCPKPNAKETEWLCRPAPLSY